MKVLDLMDSDVLVHETFYRGYPIFKWIEKHPDMDELDKEAIKATIMDALVHHDIINAKEDRLDLKHLCIVKSQSEDYYAYQEHPFVCGIPMWMKEEYRKLCIVASKHIPISLFLTDVGEQSRCIYDMNLSACFPFSNFTLCEVAYDSPTRKGIRVGKRQFPKININEEDYFVDVLTRRIFLVSEFMKRYHATLLEETTKEDLIKRDQLLYEQETTMETRFDFYIISKKIIQPINSTDDRFSENYYELEKSKKYFPQEWEKASKEFHIMKERGFIDPDFQLEFIP